jgi:hypothetical protein
MGKLKPPSPDLANYEQEHRRQAAEKLRATILSGVDLHSGQLKWLDVSGLVEYANVTPSAGRDRQVGLEMLRRARNKVAKKAAKEATSNEPTVERRAA